MTSARIQKFRLKNGQTVPAKARKSGKNAAIPLEAALQASRSFHHAGKSEKARILETLQHEHAQHVLRPETEYPRSVM